MRYTAFGSGVSTEMRGAVVESQDEWRVHSLRLRGEH